MSEQLTICLIAVGTDVVLSVLLLAALAQFLARKAWGQGGTAGALLVLLATQLIWIAPALLIVGRERPDQIAPCALWFGNWIGAMFALVTLQRTTAAIPRQLAETARLDGLGAFGMWRQIVWPFVRRDLALIALFLLMATLLPFWCLVVEPDAGNTIVIFQRSLSPQGRLAMMAAGSIVGALPILAIFFLEGRALSRPR